MNQDLHMLPDPAGVQVNPSFTAPVWHASLPLHGDTKLSQKGCMQCQDTRVIMPIAFWERG